MNDAERPVRGRSSCPAASRSSDVHAVLKPKNGYNVGLHVDSVRTIGARVGYKEAVYKIPEKEFPRPAGPAER